jgi:hypothetical protein
MSHMQDSSILSPMAIKDLIGEIDAEIARLRAVRSLLATAPDSEVRRGRPRKTTETSTPVQPAKKKRNLSPEGRARIAAAVKRRWAKQKG